MTTLTRQVTVAATVLLAGLLTVTPVSGAHAVEETAQPAQFIVKLEGGCAVEELAASYEFTVDDEVLSTKRLYRAHPTTVVPATTKDVEKIVGMLRGNHCVAYVEADDQIRIADQRQFHSWTPDPPEASSSAAWQSQSARQVLDLAAVQRTSTGANVTVAVLDTGVDALHPVLAGRLVAGYDYVDDDADPADARHGTDTDGDGLPDESWGHGTFVSGLVTMIAPGARVMPMRVLDSDGIGTVFSVAEALYDAIDAGAEVINLSLGTPEKLDSEVLKKALESAHKNQVVVVAAAGNDGSKQKQYPAASSDVLSVTATTADDSSVASYANTGGWVDVAAVGDGLVGPLPGDSYGRWSGTSMSTPVVAGQIALLRSLRPDVKSDKILQAVSKTSRKLVKTELKEGRVDLAASLAFLLDKNK